MISIDSFGIDSFTMAVPYSNFSRLPSFVLYDTILFNLTTGEVLDQFQGKPVYLERNGVKWRAYKGNFFDREYICFVVHSKMHLQSYYTYKFLNLNFQNIVDNLCLNYDCKFSLNDEIIIYDFDMTLDFMLSDNEFLALCNSFTAEIPRKFYVRSDSNLEDYRKLIGFQFGDRKSSTIQKPFFKFYSKYYEFENRKENREFVRLYGNKFEINHRRFEFTIKGKDHFHYLSKKGILSIPRLNLYNLFNVKPDDYIHIYNYALSNYQQSTYTVPNAKTTNYKPTDLFIVALAVELFNLGYSYNHIFNLLDTFNLNTVSKSRLKKRFSELIRKSLKTQPNRFKIDFKDIKKAFQR